MEQKVAEVIAQVTRDEADTQARHDLDELRSRAIEAGRERSRKIIKVTTINPQTGTIRHNPAGRVLRDWYLHVYLNTLRGKLNQPTEVIDAQQIEEMTDLIRHVRHNIEPLQAMHAVGATQKIAVADAASAAAHITERLHAIGGARAIEHAPEERFDQDQLRVQVTRHWYQRVYNNTVDEAVNGRHPLAGVSDAEEREVARTLATREVRRLIGRDGIPLVTVHGTVMNELDRRLAAGESDLTPAAPMEIPDGDAFATLAERVGRAWNDMGHEMRADWLHLADAPLKPVDSWWRNLDDVQQLKLVQHYLETHRLELLATEFKGPVIRGSEAEVARKMFNHSEPLIGGAKVGSVDSESGRTEVVGHEASIEEQSRTDSVRWVQGR